MSSVLYEYLQLFEKYKEKYGNNTALIMQVGSFYEMYGVDNKTKKLGNAIELSKVLNIVLTRKNKKISDNSTTNPLMLGFPCLALNKYVPILLEHNYTIVVVDQVKTNLCIKRIVTNVISPSTYLDTWNDEYLAMIYINKIKNDIHIGLSTISILTGNSIVYECYSLPDDKDISLDDAVSFIRKYRPREVVICATSKINKEFILRLELDNTDILCHYRNINNIVHNVEYQSAVLGTIFKHKTMLSNIEYVDLERSPYALISYVLLIEFVYDHNPMLLKKISPPTVYIPFKQLILATNTIDQLNVTSQKKGNKHTLFGTINKCSTSMGKRLLLKRLLNPIFDVEQLVQRYKQISDMANQDINTIESILDNTFDIEKLQRRMSMGVITPNEIYSLTSSYEALLELNDLLTNSKYSVTLANEEISVLKEFISICNETFIMENMLLYNFDSTDLRMFQNNIFEEVDKLHDEISKEMEKIIQCSDEISLYAESVKIDYMQNVGHYLTVSNAKATKIIGKVAKGYTFKSNKTSTKVTNSIIDNASKKIQSISDTLKLQVRKCYNGVVRYIVDKYGSCHAKFVSFVSKVDVIKSLYTVSILYNYCRPVISNSENSFIQAKNLRHPIIERLDNSTEYVPNDVNIGKDYNGIILYSMNACGKTSLLKACGLSVILAQIGCYVPASSYKFYPFKCIMTRILSEDNMVKGQSSFVAEMSELRAILKRAHDPSTLVLADEITHGTEHTSGSAIFVSSVETLAERKVNFMFTTHLHNVYPFVSKISNVKIFHLSVKFDEESIIFERKLKDGPGDSIYGLEVCQFLNMDKGFLARAFQIRKMITPIKTEPSSSIKLSRYNKTKSINNCEICNYSPKVETDMPLDVHHIKEQSIANCNGTIGNIHKDAKCNLVALCKQCHNKVHNNKITIIGYVLTTQGTKLSFDMN